MFKVLAMKFGQYVTGERHHNEIVVVVFQDGYFENDYLLE